jgi:hypothetical protein
MRTHTLAFFLSASIFGCDAGSTASPELARAVRELDAFPPSQPPDGPSAAAAGSSEPGAQTVLDTPAPEDEQIRQARFLATPADLARIQQFESNLRGGLWKLTAADARFYQTSQAAPLVREALLRAAESNSGGDRGMDEAADLMELTPREKIDFALSDRTMRRTHADLARRIHNGEELPPDTFRKRHHVHNFFSQRMLRAYLRLRDEQPVAR